MLNLSHVLIFVAGATGIILIAALGRTDRHRVGQSSQDANRAQRDGDRVRLTSREKRS